ncbi:hypothetical protein GMORB2_5439 [Geosmithia morbida]|uniref:Uncharacterized protein n=1 Tax=Geosmithia morbida TaxID=1094350 RepID=A0A9P5D290_9HYPO|nr:uncharacterized protein GMORB2_5439 [Geosmithia morbida]KAF4124773.1 hypothetical protein GMORB2_5439 [Geosmithia morbida]
MVLSRRSQGSCLVPNSTFGPATVPSLVAPFGDIVRTPKSPGTRCPTCALDGKEVWVIPGRCCGYCGTPCDEDGHEHEHEHDD